MITIRPALSSDAAAISHVQVVTWRTTYCRIVADEFLDALSELDRMNKWSELLQRPEHVTFVAETAGQGIVGFANGGPERGGRSDFRGELYAIYILSDWQVQGIGRRLVATLSQSLVYSGIDSMVVWVLADNPYRLFYERLGGQQVDEKPIRIGNQSLVEVAYGWKNLGKTLFTG